MPAHLFELFGEDAPELPKKPKTRRSEPKSENPALDNPAQADCTSKKTNPKKTNNQNTNSVLPSVVDAGVREAPGSGTEGRTDGGGDVSEDQEHGPVPDGGVGTAAAGAAPDEGAAVGSGRLGGDAVGEPSPVAVTPGVELLLAIGAEQPDLLLSGSTLRDQGLMVTGMLTAGWTAAQLHQVIASRPLPVPIWTTVGAVIGSRLRAAAAAPAPSSVPGLPAQQGVRDAGWRPIDGPTPQPPLWVERQAEDDPAATGPMRNCSGDDGLCERLAVPGRTLCGRHLGWGLCPQCNGRRVEPGRPLCDNCERDNTIAAPTDDEFAALLAEATRPAQTGPAGHAAPF